MRSIFWKTVTKVRALFLGPATLRNCHMGHLTYLPADIKTKAISLVSSLKRTHGHHE